MTTNQIAYQNMLSQRAANLETARANKAREEETHRSNVAKEVETNRSNLVTEKIANRNSIWGNINSSINAGANVAKAVSSFMPKGK